MSDDIVQEVVDEVKEIVVIQPEMKDVLSGVELSKAGQIQAIFTPYMTQLRAYEKDYKDIIEESKTGITDELGKRAKRLKLDIGKQRTTSDKDRKDYKADVDLFIKAINGTNNIVKLFASEMESNLEDIVKHQERAEAESREKLKQERIEMLAEVGVTDVEYLGLEIMQEEVFFSYFDAKKTSFLEVKKAEEKAEADRVELERVTKRQETRRFQCSRLVDYITGFESIDFGNMKDGDYEDLVHDAKTKRDDHEKKQEQIRLENEKLRQEKIEAEKTRVAEAKKAEDEILRVEKISNDKIEAERKKAESEKLKIQKANDLKLKKEREENERLKKVESDRLAKEATIKKAQDDADKKALLAPDKTKLENLILTTGEALKTVKDEKITTIITLALNELQKGLKDLEG